MTNLLTSNRNAWVHGLMTAACAMLLAAPPAGTGAEERVAATTATLPPAIDHLSHDQLKAIYLECDRTALAGQLTPSDIAFCSTIYETLKQRVFGGDFFALIAWSNPDVARRLSESVAAARVRSPGLR